MKKKALLLVIFVGACAHFLQVAAQDKSLGGQLVTTIDSSISDRWNRVMSNDVPGLSIKDRVVVGQKIFVVPLIWGFSAAPGKEAHVDYNLTVKTPSGKVYFNADGIPAISGIANPMSIRMASQYIYLNFDPPDEKGVYEILMIVNDRNSGDTAQVKSKVELIDKNEVNVVFKTQADFDEWNQDYFENKSPENLVYALSYYLDSKLFEDKIVWPLFLGFFATALRENPWQYDSFIKLYQNANDNKKAFMGTSKNSVSFQRCPCKSLQDLHLGFENL